MSEAALFLLAPLCMCIILVGIHCYLGLHVLARGVIFVDLALAQVAVLGGTAAFMVGFDHHSAGSYVFSLILALLAALFLTLTNRVRRQVSQEAIIGIVYAFSAAVVVILIEKMSHGAEHLKYALTGQVLWVTWREVLITLGVYSLVGAIHFVYRKKLLAASHAKSTHWVWDFVFYALFAIVITSSVQVAGVLLVFAFLIVPALMGSLFFQTLRARLAFGWITGTTLAAIGLGGSYLLDLPSGAFLVALYTSIMLATLFIVAMLDAMKKS